MPARNDVAVVARTMAVFEALARFEGSAELKSVAAKTGIGKSTVFRILYTLKKLGYVEQASQGGAYSTTAKVFSLARSPVKKPRLTTIAHPYLVRLRDQLQESAWLAQWRRGVAILVDVVESEQPLRLSYDVGDRCPLHASALGKSIAAQLSEPELEALLQAEQFTKFTRHTIGQATELRKELAKVRQRGYALNNQETVEGAVVIASPLLIGPGEIAGAISVSAPIARCPPRKREEIVKEVKKTATAIGEYLVHIGYRVPQTEHYSPSAHSSLEAAP